MRGKQNATTQFSVANRITPADAGKTRPANKMQGKSADHPRGCGENAEARIATA